eukprot:13825905-Ditylum_brightwellii.AAC.1
MKKASLTSNSVYREESIPHQHHQWAKEDVCTLCVGGDQDMRINKLCVFYHEHKKAITTEKKKGSIKEKAIHFNKGISSEESKQAKWRRYRDSVLDKPPVVSVEKDEANLEDKKCTLLSSKYTSIAVLMHAHTIMGISGDDNKTSRANEDDEKSRRL